jgi:penicillin-binding protein 1A
VKSRTLRIVISLAGIGAVLALGIIYAFLCSYVYLAPSLPNAAGLRTLPLQVPLRVYTRSGALISQIGEQRRVPVSYEEIPQLVREAFLAAEDDRFFQHGGIDYFSMLRSIYVDLTTRDYSQGASTITMQTARNMFLTRDKNIGRKLQEIFLTLRMEHDFTKQEILDTYLNVIFFGQRAYGVEAAAEVYFGKPIGELTVAEAAMLAGLPQAPSRFNPVTSPQRAAERRRSVLQRMLALRFIDADTARRAMNEEIRVREYAPLYAVEAPYVAEIARQLVVARFGEAAVNAGYRVITTIDGRLQTAANRALRLGLIEYDRRHGYRGAIRRVALDASAVPHDFEALLTDVPPVGNLQAAVVVSVAPSAARVYVRGGGFAQIDWDGMSWARGDAAGGRADGLLHRGDLIYVLSDAHGNAQLAQVPAVQGGLVALDPHDGAVVALVGGFDYFANAWNHVTQARRQPGSGFKPFLYSCALEHGFTPASIIMDAPVVMAEGGVEQVWRPENEGGKFSGPTRLREALVHSRNLVSIRLLRAVGTDQVLDYATRFGFDRANMPNNLTLALGTLSATPLEVATGYAAFANGGFRVSPYFIERIENGLGETVWRETPREVCATCTSPAPAAPATAATPAAAAATAPAAGAGPAGATASTPASELTANPGAASPFTPVEPTVEAPPGSDALTVAPPLSERLPPLIAAGRSAPRIISAPNAWLMDDIMADVIKRGTGVRARALGRSDISGKTGTTNESHDTWFNGFNPNLEATVWVGFDQEQPLGEGEEGSSVAVPIWVRLMREGLRGLPDLPRPVPPGLVTARVDPLTGQLARPNEASAVSEYFFADKLPALGVGSAGTPAAGSEPLF